MRKVSKEEIKERILEKKEELGRAPKRREARNEAILLYRNYDIDYYEFLENELGLTKPNEYEGTKREKERFQELR